MTVPGWYALDGKTPVPCEMVDATIGLPVAKSEVGPYSVSTVFLSLDQGFGKGPPVLFETMIFGPDERDGDCWRYATWSEAEEGHAKAVASLNAGKPRTADSVGTEPKA